MDHFAIGRTSFHWQIALRPIHAQGIEESNPHFEFPSGPISIPVGPSSGEHSILHDGLNNRATDRRLEKIGRSGIRIRHHRVERRDDNKNPHESLYRSRNQEHDPTHGEIYAPVYYDRDCTARSNWSGNKAGTVSTYARPSTGWPYSTSTDPVPGKSGRQWRTRLTTGSSSTCIKPRVAVTCIWFRDPWTTVPWRCSKWGSDSVRIPPTYGIRCTPGSASGAV